jgi:hypothetical protein
MNIGFHPAPSSRSGTRPLPAPRISPSPRSLRAPRLPRSGRGVLCVKTHLQPCPGPCVGVHPQRLGAFTSPNLSLLNFKLLALLALRNEGRSEGSHEGSVVEGSTACPGYPACPEPRREPRRKPRREERREHSRRVNLFSLRLLPAVDCKLSAVSSHSSSPNSHRITSFAHPHPLTPVESNLCKKQGAGGPYPPSGGTDWMTLSAPSTE